MNSHNTYNINSNKKIVIAGHICLDISPIFPHINTDKIEDILAPGKLINNNGINISTGGAVANTGIAMKILGNNVSLMGKIGNDDFGNIIIDKLKDYDVHNDMLISENENTSYSIVLAIPNIDRIFLHTSGANNTFCIKDLDMNLIKESILFHFGYPTIMRSMYKDNGIELTNMYKEIKNHNVATSLDLSAIDENSEVAHVDWDYILKETLPYVDFFVPSIEELCFILDKKLYKKCISKNKDIIEEFTIEEVDTLANKAISYGTKVVLIKCGSRGMYYKTSSEEIIKPLCQLLNLNINEWANKKGFQHSFIPTKIVSASGAGDTSIATFLTCVLNEYDIEKSVKLAAANGACCVSTHDALSGLLTLNELESKIEKGWKNNVS